jgi:5'(3')-deoxyribonucleotidase
MTKAIYFDMDGTIADLYNVPDWENKLNAYDVSPYVDAMPLVNMDKLNSILDKFIAIGYVIGVISWSAKHGTKEYNKETRKAKKEWIKNNLPCVSEFHVVKYGTSKHTTAKVRGSILVDDNAQVRKAWEKYTEENFTIDASDTANLLKNLEKVLAMAA